MLELGQVVMTRGVAHHCETDPENMLRITVCLRKHASGDWGDLCDDDKEENDRAVIDGDRILSAYKINGRKIWIITEWDRSVTTVLFPDEY